jgi:O-antigen/teichoic acid export membrane protein
MKKNPFIQGAMIATIGIVISKILGIIYVIPFYAVIGQKGGALYGYAYAMYSIFLNLSSIGIPLAFSRLTSEYNALDQHYLKE